MDPIFLAFLVSFCALRGIVPNKILLLVESQNIWPPKKISGWPRYCPQACSKNNISMISVFTLRNILIVNTKIIKGKLSNIFISEVIIKLVALCINRHTISSSQLQEGW